MIAALRSRWRAFTARRAAVVGINRRNAELVYRHNARRDYPIADDKLVTKRVLAAAGVPVPETLATCASLSEVLPTLARISALDEFVVKPANGSGGDGILVVKGRHPRGGWRASGGRELGLDDLRTHLAHVVFGAFSGELEDRAIVERRVEGHPFFAELWADGLSDLRIITLRGRAVIAMVRVPTHRSRGRANLHQGGIGLAVDLATGTTIAALAGGRHVAAHPETGVPLLGRTVPDWPAVIAIAERTAAVVPLGYLGVDVVVDRLQGPLVIEINARPGLEIQNVHGRGLEHFLAEATA